MTGRARWRLLALAFAVVASSPACGVIGDDGITYEVTARFARAVSLYEDSRVKVMGFDVGRVTEITPEGRTVRVRMRIRHDVPLPADVGASIVPLTLVGERNVVLFPPWQPGDERAVHGHEIGVDRTVIPVEPDEALQAFTDLARAIDPDAVTDLVANSARALEGQGPRIAEALSGASRVSASLAAQDERLVDIARHLQVLASTLNQREAQLGSVIQSFSRAASVLAEERDAIAGFLGSVVRFTDEGTALVDAIGGTLPGDLATLAEVGRVLEATLDRVEEGVLALPALTDLLIRTYDPEAEAFRLAATGGPSAIEVLRPLYDIIGLPPICLPILGTQCPPGTIP